MCGIVGAFAFDSFEKKSEEKRRTEASIFITTQLLQMTVDRGKDATGISMLWADGNYSGLKMGIPSPEFIARFGEEETEFKGMLKLWREYPKLCRVFMGHCRKASKGNSWDNINNHPIQVGDMIFVHNGTLDNDDVIFEKLQAERKAAVDSEAIGHLLHYYTKNGTEPFTKEVIEETTRRLSGSYSVIAANGNNPYQVAQFRDGRPAEAVLVKPLKTVFVASEKKYLETILFEYNKFVQLFSSIDLPYLKKDDVDFKTMVDDSYLIWDLTTPIEKDTTIDDLYDWGKVPLRVDKVWKGTTTKTYNTGYQGNNTSKKTVAATSVQSNKTNSVTGSQTTGTSKTTTDSQECVNTGVVWSDRLNKYKTSKGIDTTKKIGAVEVNIDNGTVNYLAPENNDEGDLTEVDKNKIEKLLTGAATVNEVAISRTETSMEEVKKTSDVAAEDMVEIDMTVPSPAAIKAADEHCKGLAKFGDEETVATELDLDDVSVLEALPIHALANRIMKKLYAKAFAEGFDSGNQRKTASNEADKLDKANRKISTMKTVVSLFGRAAAEHMPDDERLDTFLDALADYVKPTALKRLDLAEVFSVGDLKNIPLVAELQRVIELEKSK